MLHQVEFFDVMDGWTVGGLDGWMGLQVPRNAFPVDSLGTYVYIVRLYVCTCVFCVAVVGLCERIPPKKATFVQM